MAGKSTQQSICNSIAESLQAFSLGAWLIVGIAVCSSLFVLFRQEQETTGLEMWTYARTHVKNYEPIVDTWNRDPANSEPMNIFIIGPKPLERRLLSGFMSGTPVADLLEIERSMSGLFFSGPVEAVGFTDLTQRLHDEGLYEQINGPSFGPWTSRGRIFGIPHDVHPVLLGYRADIIEQAGIEMSTIETWDQFAETLRPLITDIDGDARPDRYLLNIWHTNIDAMEVLFLQAGGQFFGDTGKAIVNSDINATVLATIVSWVCGPDRIAIDAPEFTASGNQLRLDGMVICSLVPDWLCGVWKNDLPTMEGKIKLMPLPAWTPNGRRTSVWGGTMLGIAKSTSDFEASWKFAKHLYFSDELAESVYKTIGIISPVKKTWDMPFYDKPSPYFCNQAPGRLYVQAAPDVPFRTSSPFNEMAKDHVKDAAVDLRRYAIANKKFTVSELIPQAHILLERAESRVRRQMQRNVFHSERE